MTASGSVTSARLAREEESRLYRLRVAGQNASLRLSEPVMEPGGTIRFTWASVTGRKYTLEMTSRLTPAVWQEIATTTANGSVASAQIAIGRSQAFYRVKALNQ
jgi:hypothetical protein